MRKDRVTQRTSDHFDPTLDLVEAGLCAKSSRTGISFIVDLHPVFGEASGKLEQGNDEGNASPPLGTSEAREDNRGARGLGGKRGSKMYGWSPLRASTAASENVELSTRTRGYASS